jgi:hypothetical protein
MALDSAEVVVVGGGNVYLAPVGTPMPTDLADPTTPWENIGYLEETGPAPTGFNRDKTSLYAWNTNTPLRTSYAPSEPSIDFTLLQVSEDTLALYFGGGTTVPGTAGAPDVYTAPDSSTPQPWAMVLDWFDGAIKYRWCIPSTTVAASGDITLTREQFLQMPVSASILTPSGGGAPFTLLWGDAGLPTAAQGSQPAQVAA